jgi:energy-coupling factor transport system permease protein
MAESYSLFRPRPGRLHRLHPLTRLALSALPAAAGLALPGLWTGYLAAALGVLPLALAARLLPDLARAVLRTWLPFVVSIFLVQGFFWPGGTPVLALGPFSLKAQGLEFTIQTTGKLLTILGSFLWFAMTTRPDALVAAFTSRGFPPSLSYMVVATIQIIPRFQGRAAAIIDAQRARGLETGGSLARRLRGILPLVTPLILGSLIDVEERALAIEARAFNHPGPKTRFTALDEAVWEPAARLALILASLACLGLGVYLRLRG